MLIWSTHLILCKPVEFPSIEFEFIYFEKKIAQFQIGKIKIFIKVHGSLFDLIVSLCLFLNHNTPSMRLIFFY